MPLRNLNIAIVDYQLGNLFSVKHACKRLGYEPEITSDPERVYGADAVILPGVGAFKAAMDNLTHSGLAEAITTVVRQGKPFMGVCLGMQLLFETSEEFEASAGLGLLPGRVEKLPADPERNVKVPQIAWNTIARPQGRESWSDTPLAAVDERAYMYFVHSYYVRPTRAEDRLTETTYGGFTYCSAVSRDNIFATQFHPEKSGETGLMIYANWFKRIN